MRKNNLITTASSQTLVEVPTPNTAMIQNDGNTWCDFFNTPTFNCFRDYLGNYDHFSSTYWKNNVESNAIL